MAGIREILEEMQGEMTCAICRIHLSQPVTIECMHSFCRACLFSSWTTGPSSFSCPLCRQVSEGAELPGVSDVLAQVTDLTKQLSSQLLQSTEGHSHCATHKEIFKLFCEDEQTPLCVTCSQNPEHRDHKLSPVEEAALNSRKKLQDAENHLGKSFEESEKCLAQEKRHVADWHSVIQEEYVKLLLFLKEEESIYLERIRQEQRERRDRLCQIMQTLQNLRLEIQEAGHQPHVDLLHDVKHLLRRSQTALAEVTVPHVPEPREYPISGLIEMLKQFRVDLSMDPMSATDSVTVSEDLKSVKARDGWQVDTKLRKGPIVHAVLAEQSFNSGRHYWEVDVSQLPKWLLGIFMPFMRQNINVDSINNIFLLRCSKTEEGYHLQTYPTFLQIQVKGPLPRIGVYLEYTPGTLTFYNVLQRSLIYRFHSIPFTAPVTPIFSPGPPLPGTKAGAMTLCPMDSHLCACCYSSL